jgi:hypothetical protein
MKEKRVVPKVQAVAVASVIHIAGVTPRAFAGWLGTAFVLAVERSKC